MYHWLCLISKTSTLIMILKEVNGEKALQSQNKITHCNTTYMWGYFYFYIYCLWVIQFLTWRAIFLLDINLLQIPQVSWSWPKCFSLTCLLQLDWSENCFPHSGQENPVSGLRMKLMKTADKSSLETKIPSSQKHWSGSQYKFTVYIDHE